jgi:hypothetical protein
LSLLTVTTNDLEGWKDTNNIVRIKHA